MAAYEKTLQDAMDDLSFKQISSVVSSSPQFAALLNEVGESLAIRGGWFDLEQRMQFSISGCHIVWPHFVGTILGVRFCDGLANMQGQWYSFVNHDIGGSWREVYGVGSGYGDGQFNPYTQRSANRAVIEDAGSRPCYNEISGQLGNVIQYNVVLAEDIGKTITLFGKKFGGQPLQEKINGVTQNGITLTAATPFIQSSDSVTDISAITRQATKGMAYLYEVDATTGLLRDLAIFQPYETNPRYRCSRIHNHHPTQNGNNPGTGNTSVEALVKLKFIRAVNPRDFLPISNFRALKLGIQAVKLEQADDDAAALVKWNLAVAELQREQEFLLPKKQLPVRINLGRVVSSPI